MRYDLTLAYKRIEQVKTAGYSGPALVCAIYFAPLAGHVPDRSAVKYLIDQRDMETWLVPIAGHPRPRPVQGRHPDSGRAGDPAGNATRSFAATEPGERRRPISVACNISSVLHIPTTGRLTLRLGSGFASVNKLDACDGRKSRHSTPDLARCWRHDLHVAVNGREHAASQRFGRVSFQTRSIA